MLQKRENLVIYLISLFIQSYNALSLLGNCTEDSEGQWFTCVKFVGKMNSSSCTRTCSFNKWNQFGLNDFENFSDGLQYFLKRLNLKGFDNQLNEPGHSEWSILEYVGAKNKNFECNICTKIYYNFGDKEWTDGEIGLQDKDFVRRWKNKFQNVWYQSKKDIYAFEPYQPDTVVLPRKDFQMVPII